MNNLDIKITINDLRNGYIDYDKRNEIADAYEKSFPKQPEITPEHEYICPVCRSSNGSGFKFCRECGQALNFDTKNK